MKALLKGVGIGLVMLVGILLLIGAVFYITGREEVVEVYDVSPALSSVSVDSVSLARGQHLVQLLGCSDCHGEKFEGRVMVDIPPFRAVASNLTGGSGGIGERYTDGDWDRAIRYGIAPEGSGLLLMPSNLYYPLSDRDAGAIIAFLKNLSAVDNQLPETEVRSVGYLMAGIPGIDMYPNVFGGEESREPAPAESATPEYGAYLSSIVCAACHGPMLRGGPFPDVEAPAGPDLKAAGSWPLTEFATAIREGRTPDGRSLAGEEVHGARSYDTMTDLEIEALHLYLKGIQAAAE